MSEESPESHMIAPRWTKSWRWLVAIGLVVLAGVVFLYGGRWVRKTQYWLTGSVSALGNIYYVQPEDDTITPRLLETGVWEPYETQEAREILRPGDTFVDVGADFGWYTVIGAKAVGPTGRVIAFEPVPQNLEFLRRNIVANGYANVKIEPMALSNKSEKLTFHLNRHNLGGHSMLGAADRPDATDVQAMTLDEYLKDYSGKIALIKIDTEGAEGYILEGMRETLRKHPEMVILMEFTPSGLRQAGFDPEAMLRKMHGQGYEIRYFNQELDSGENAGPHGYVWTEIHRMRSLQHRMGSARPPSHLEVPHAHAHCTACSGLGNRPRFVAPQPVPTAA
jgi:FkbM family methyltransferase